MDNGEFIIRIGKIWALPCFCHFLIWILLICSLFCFYAVHFLCFFCLQKSFKASRPFCKDYQLTLADIICKSPYAGWHTPPQSQPVTEDECARLHRTLRAVGLFPPPRHCQSLWHCDNGTNWADGAHVSPCELNISTIEYTYAYIKTSASDTPMGSVPPPGCTHPTFKPLGSKCKLSSVCGELPVRILSSSLTSWPSLALICTFYFPL